MILSWWIHDMVHLSKLIGCTAPRVNPIVNCGLWLIPVCQYWFNSCNAVISLTQDVNNKGISVLGERWYMVIFCTICSIFCKPKITLKKSTNFFKKKNKQS